MRERYVLSPQAALDLAEIWLYLERNASISVADEVESQILDRILFVATNPGVGHSRRDLTHKNVKFFPVYSYLIVYRPETTPLEIVSVLHGRRDVEEILSER